MEILEFGIDPRIPISVLIINFILYVGLVWKMSGVQPSISDSFYSWEEKLGYPWGHLFTAFCMFLAFPLLVLAEYIPENWQWISLLSGGGFGFTGVACMIKDPKVAAVHGKAAVIGIFAGLGMIATFGGWYILVIFLGLGLSGILALIPNRNKIWWIECVAFLTIMGSFFWRFFL